MPAIGTPSLDQIRVFLTVVEIGSFAGAARKLNRATSAVSYTIANLEQQLGVKLFDREHTRKPVLTDAGQAVLAKAHAVSSGVDDLRASVRGLLDGLEAELTVVVDVMFPPARVADALKAFETTFPTVKLRLYMEALGAVPQLVQRGIATVGFGGGMRIVGGGLEMISLGDVEMIPVAAPGHPLAQLQGAAKPGEARRHRQLILTVRSQFEEGDDVGIFAAEAWRLADLGAKRALLLAGTGWGNMPIPTISEDLAAGRLVRLDLPEIGSGRYLLHALYRTHSPPGPAARWLIQRFVDQTD
ncbi:LysR family transcriptional regulator [Kaistia sp. 32K]|uniref:LysR family transcriptional regulator n=1 Tax=Kaistia sp. 32K TaxID=2795690 RepID=UPI001916370E|nr:LysR family transcriptional regulator [Kaistia sp. 32K]BCP53849.1 LysR family transcriptional regulator [Kaistia sp. 32K]